MPWLGALLWGLIASAVPWVISHGMRAIGLAFVTYVGITVGLNQAEVFIFDKFNNVGGELFHILQLAGVGQGIAILFSCFSAALVLKTASSAAGSRQPVWKKPGTPFEA